ncbi:MAG: hypothetical protein L3J82_09905, partial [Planctomycetes bacterium]|nr:hypothetical protein [Planctomycetota bacterium]
DTKQWNNYWWDSNGANNNHPAWYSPPNPTDNNRVNLDLDGWLAKGIRVTIAAEHQIRIVDNVIYETYAENPDLRRRPYRQSAAALSMTEMLGVYAREWLLLENSSPNTFQDMYNIPKSAIDSDGINNSSSQNIAVYAGPMFEAPDGTSHTPPTNPYNSNSGLMNSDATAQNCLDGVFMSGGYVVRSHRRHNPWSARSWRTLWICGSFIANGVDAAGLRSYPNLIIQNGAKNYNYDYRMKITTPPYFLIAYNTSAKMLPGSWLSYTQ